MGSEHKKPTRLPFMSKSAGYVFYETLQDQAEVDPAANILKNNVLGSYANFTDKSRGQAAAQETASVLKSMGYNEAKKELTALKTYFNGLVTNLNEEELFTKGFEKELAVAFNYALHSKEIFERYYKRITGKDVDGNQINKSDDKLGHAKITIAKFMPGYIGDAFKSELQKRLKPAQSYKSLQDLMNHALKILNNNSFLTQTIQDGIYKALESGDWKENDTKGLLEVKQAMETLNPTQRNDIVNQISANLRIDEIIQGIVEELKSGIFIDKRSKKGIISKIQATLVSKMDNNKYVGELNEYISVMISNLLAKKKLSNGHFIGKQVGGLSGKADMIEELSMSVQSSNYTQILEDLYKNSGGYSKDSKSNRVRNIRLVQEAYDKISKVGDPTDFIIYGNAKEYSLLKKSPDKDSNFEKRGFSAGKPQNLLNFRQTWGMIDQDADKIANAIAQLLDGSLVMAQKGPSFRESIKKQLMSDLAYFLFDDFATIGNMQEDNVKQIHLLDLDGIVIPLSYILLLVAEAVEYCGENPSKFFMINISTKDANSGKIIYPERFDDPNITWTKEMWEEQRNDAYNITVGARFLRNFVEIVEDLMK